MRALFVIEGKGKIAAMHAALSRVQALAGFSGFEVLATRGHVGRQLSDLNLLALTTAWEETHYGPDPERKGELASIRRAAERADRIYLAADDDQEGDVIARDVHRFALDGRPALRCRLRAIDAAAIKEAIASARPFESQLATKGDARRIADRAIGAALSDVSHASNKRPVGRVFSTAIAAVSKFPCALGLLRLNLRSSDGGRPFSGSIPVTARTDVAALLLASRQSAIPSTEAPARLSLPMNYVDIVAVASEQFGLTLREASDGLQAAYEEGLVSYPRAAARAISADGLSVCQAIAERNGATFQPGELPIFDRRDEGAHESPRPLVEIDLSNQRGNLSLSRRITVLVGRHLIECGQRYSIEGVRPESLAPALRPFAARFTRTQIQGWLPWKPPLARDGIRHFTKEVALLRALEALGLGRPATWVDHVEKLVSRDVFSDDLQLTRKGKDLLALAHSRGVHSDFSSVIEQVIEAGSSERPGELARQAVASASSEAYSLINTAIGREADQRPEFA